MRSRGHGRTRRRPPGPFRAGHILRIPLPRVRCFNLSRARHVCGDVARHGSRRPRASRSRRSASRCVRPRHRGGTPAGSKSGHIHRYHYVLLLAEAPCLCSALPRSAIYICLPEDADTNVQAPVMTAGRSTRRTFIRRSALVACDPIETTAGMVCTPGSGPRVQSNRPRPGAREC